MMYGYGVGWGAMVLMPLAWLVLVSVIVLAVWLALRPATRSTPQDRETPQEILDRRYARGEIDADGYTAARARLAGREPGPR